MLAVLVMTAMSVNAEKNKAGNKTVVFHTDIECKNCQAKIEKNIPYEKGVKGLNVDLENKTVTITYREDKNDEASLKKALEKLDIKVFEEEKACCKNEACKDGCKECSGKKDGECHDNCKEHHHEHK